MGACTDTWASVSANAAWATGGGAEPSVGGRRLSFVRSGAAIALAGMLAVALSACGQGASQTSPPGSVASHRAGRFTDPGFGWSIRYPAGMEVTHFQCAGMITSDGVRVTNFPSGRPGSCTPLGWLRGFPATGVAVQVWFSERIPVPPPLRDSAFPLPPASFRRAGPYVGGAEPPPQVSGLYGNGFPFTAAVWVGRGASRAGRSAAWAVVRSLRFPALREGTIWRAPARLTSVTYYVLGRASRYPAGSVTAFPAASLPGSRSFLGVMSGKGFYLIHAPRAFYVVERRFEKSAQPFTTCTAAFDPKAFQFFCPGTGLRWNRLGQPLGAHVGGGPDWAMGLHIATVAQDGHVLFSPDFGPLLPIDLTGNPWG